MQAAFYRGRKRLFNRVTAWWLRGDFSHCELVFGYDPSGLAVCASSSFMDGGVRVKHIALDPAHWVLVDVPGDVAQARTWVAQHHGQGYDLLGLAGFVARRLGQDKARWTCCEAVAAMLAIDEPWRFDPCALHALLAWRARPPTANATTTARPADAGLVHFEGV